MNGASKTVRVPLEIARLSRLYGHRHAVGQLKDHLAQARADTEGLVAARSALARLRARDAEALDAWLRALDGSYPGTSETKPR